MGEDGGNQVAEVRRAVLSKDKESLAQSMDQLGELCPVCLFDSLSNKLFPDFGDLLLFLLLALLCYLEGEIILFLLDSVPLTDGLVPVGEFVEFL